MIQKIAFITCLVLLHLYMGAASSSADYQKGLEAGQKGDFAGAIRELKPLAEKGDSPSQCLLGWVYKNVQKGKLALTWITRAAEQGNAHCQGTLGGMYMGISGQSVEKDYAVGIKWLKKSALNGNASGQFILGMMYADGRGVAKSYRDARKWYSLAAKQGLPIAQGYLKSLEQDILEEAKEECIDMGFKIDTEKYDNCVTQMTN